MSTLITIMIVLANFTANIGEINNSQWHRVYTLAHSDNTVRVYEDGSVADYSIIEGVSYQRGTATCLSVGACQDYCYNNHPHGCPTWE